MAKFEISGTPPGQGHEACLEDKALVHAGGDDASKGLFGDGATKKGRNGRDGKIGRGGGVLGIQLATVRGHLG